MLLKQDDHTVLVTPQGGSILQWQYREHMILGPTRIVRINEESKVRGETHWCWPNFGSVPEDVTPKCPKHGVLRGCLLDVSRSDHRSARFEMDSLQYDGRIKLSAVVSLVGETGTLSSWLTVTNHDKERFPVLPALHPYFAVPDGGVKVIIDRKVVANSLPGLSVMAFSDKAKIFPRTGDVSVELRGIGRVDMKLPEHCTNIVLWSDDPYKYVCVEPVFGIPGTFGKKEGHWLGQNENMYCQVDFQFTPA